MADNIIVMPGSARVDFSSLETVAREFGWIVQTARNADEVAAMKPALAVFICRDALGPDSSWPAAIRFLHEAQPEAPVIVLHGFSELFDWPDLCDAGAFHSLWLPLKANEVRQSLGFLSHAGRRAACLPAWNNNVTAVGAQAA